MSRCDLAYEYGLAAGREMRSFSVPSGIRKMGESGAWIDGYLVGIGELDQCTCFIVNDDGQTLRQIYGGCRYCEDHGDDDDDYDDDY